MKRALGFDVGVPGLILSEEWTFFLLKAKITIPTISRRLYWTRAANDILRENPNLD